MSDVIQFRITTCIFVISIALTLFAPISNKLGWGDPYPFFSWKLFSQPRGSNHVIKEYRIYSIEKYQESFTRKSINSCSTYDTDDYVYTLNYWTDEFLKDTNNKCKEINNLVYFVKTVVPNQVAYKIVRETYRPHNLSVYNFKYDTSTVIFIGSNSINQR